MTIFLYLTPGKMDPFAAAPTSKPTFWDRLICDAYGLFTESIFPRQELKGGYQSYHRTCKKHKSILLPDLSTKDHAANLILDLWMIKYSLVHATHYSYI